MITNLDNPSPAFDGGGDPSRSIFRAVGMVFVFNEVNKLALAFGGHV
jgi:hypothetical protein